jgi:hypothetical protein
MGRNKEEFMTNKIIEGELFASPFTRKVYKVKKIHVNFVLMEEVGNESRQLLTEKGTIRNFKKSWRDDMKTGKTEINLEN